MESSPASTSWGRWTASVPGGWKSCAHWSVSEAGGATIRRRPNDGAAGCASGARGGDQLGGDGRGNLVADREHRWDALCGRQCVRRAAVACWRAAVPDADDRHRLGRRGRRRRGVRGCGRAIALRANAVAHHPIVATFGTSVEVAVTPTESAIPVGHGRLLFRAVMRHLGSGETYGRAVVFAPARDFGAVMVGQPIRFCARVTPPTRHDLTVAG